MTSTGKYLHEQLPIFAEWSRRKQLQEAEENLRTRLTEPTTSRVGKTSGTRQDPGKASPSTQEGQQHTTLPRNHMRTDSEDLDLPGPDPQLLELQESMKNLMGVVGTLAASLETLQKGSQDIRPRDNPAHHATGREEP